MFIDRVVFANMVLVLNGYEPYSLTPDTHTDYLTPGELVARKVRATAGGNHREIVTRHIDAQWINATRCSNWGSGFKQHEGNTYGYYSPEWADMVVLTTPFITDMSLHADHDIRQFLFDGGELKGGRLDRLCSLDRHRNHTRQDLDPMSRNPRKNRRPPCDHIPMLTSAGRQIKNHAFDTLSAARNRNNTSPVQRTLDHLDSLNAQEATMSRPVITTTVNLAITRHDTEITIADLKALIAEVERVGGEDTSVVNLNESTRTWAIALSVKANEVVTELSEGDRADLLEEALNASSTRRKEIQKLLAS